MISGIVLAAGTSSRFGRTKQLLEYRGKPLVQHAIDALGAVDEIVVVLGHDAERVGGSLQLPPTGQIVLNPRYAEGQSTSLAAGLAACSPDSEATVILMADQPGIEPDHIARLVGVFRTTRAKIVRLRFRDGPGPALLSREIWGRAKHLRGDTGARELMASHPDWVEEVEIDAEGPPDIDTPDDAGHVGGRFDFPRPDG